MTLTATWALIGLFAQSSHAQVTDEKPSLNAAKVQSDQRLEASLSELSRLEASVSEETIELSRELAEHERILEEVKREYSEKRKRLDEIGLEASTLGKQIEGFESEVQYFDSLIGDYVRNLEVGLHIAEIKTLGPLIAAARTKHDLESGSFSSMLDSHGAVLDASILRLQDALGGHRFEGEAVDLEGRLYQGTFLFLGPVAIFRSTDNSCVGYVTEQLNSDQPTVVPFKNELDRGSASQLVAAQAGNLPLDPTIGNAYKVEAIDESFMEHIKKGGPIMLPIFVIAGIALLVAVGKWISLSLIRMPSAKGIGEVMSAVRTHSIDQAKRAANEMKGPVGVMLSRGIEHISEPKELVEEVMYETVLETRLKLQKLLPFIALTASSAPLLGLLGTVTGIMKTFALMTEFGGGDVKSLSSGISEALITTEWGLYVAIPALIIYAFLSRKARAVIEQMEKAGIALMNHAARANLAA